MDQGYPRARHWLQTERVAPGTSAARRAAGLSVLAGAYFVAAKIGIALPVAHGVVTPVWAPSGIALGAMLLYGRRLWPAVALGAFLANATSGVPLVVALGIAAGNTLEAVIGWQLLQGRMDRRLERVRDVVALLVFGGLLAAPVAATIGTTSLLLGGETAAASWLPDWMLWWFGDGIGITVVTPLLLAYAGRKRRTLKPRAAEAAALLASIVVVSSLVFVGRQWSYPYLLFPLVMWAAVRFGQLGAAAGTLVVSAVAIAGTASGSVPVAGASALETTATVQAMVAAMGLAALVLSATVSQRERSRQAHRASEETFRELFESAPGAMAQLDPSGRFLKANRACQQLLGYREQELQELTFPEVIHADERPQTTRLFERLLHGQVGSFKIENRYQRRDGSSVWVESSVSLLHDADGKPSVGHVMSQDISQRKRAEEQLGRLAAIVESSEDAITSGTMDGVITSWNQGAERLYGYEAGEALGRPISMLVPEGRPNEFAEILDLVRCGERVRGFETVLARKDGSEVMVSLAVSPVTDPHGEIVGTAAIARDVTARRRTERALREANARFASGFHHALVGMALVGLDGRFIQANPAFMNITGYSEQELCATTLQTLTHPADVGTERRYLEQLVAGKVPSYRIEKRFRHSEGHLVWALVGVSMAASHEGKPLHLIYQVEDITERKQAVERLAHQALHDSLTGLANRALLLDRLQHALSRVGRGSGLVAVMFLDLDRFKVINDSLGHKEGDRVLAAVGERLMKILRPSDTVGRFGGDEFVVICESVESEHRAFQIARRLNDSIGEPIPLPSGDVRLTASVGVALSREPSASPEALIRNADAAMYRAKERGRARYEVYDAAMQERAIRRLQVENDLRTAIESGELRLFYQPQVRLSDSRIVGVEALVRWEHPQRGLLMPEEFIGVAEEAGLISGLGKWVLEAACRDLGGPRPPGTNLTVAFNVSAAELTRPNYVDQVEEALARSNTLPERLHLEITETLLVDANHYTLGALQALHAMGIQLVIDDFGTGYASLAYLRRFPVDVLKIDRSFVAGLKPGSEDLAIVDAVVKLAHCLNLECVAEGVETTSQLDQLRELGCDLAQGYHFGRPVPIDILTEMLT